MINFLGLEIPLYGLLFFSGILIAGVLGLVIAIKRKIDLFDFFAVIAYVLIGAILGAKLLFIAVSWDQIQGLPLEDILKGGFVFYGGLIGGALGLLIYHLQYKVDFWQFADLFTLLVPLGHAFGRIGCLLGGCCYGMEYHGPLSIVYGEDTLNWLTPRGVPLFPVQAVESACLLVLFGVLCLLVRNPKFKQQPGACTAGYAVGYSIIRFVLEFFRGDSERGGFLGISTSQWVSIAIVLAIGAWATWMILKKKKAAQAATAVEAVACDEAAPAAEMAVEEIAEVEQVNTEIVSEEKEQA